MLKKVVSSVEKFVKEEEAQGLTEYGLIIGLVVIVVVGALTLLGGSLNDKFTAIKDSLSPKTTTP